MQEANRFFDLVDTGPNSLYQRAFRIGRRCRKNHFFTEQATRGMGPGSAHGKVAGMAHYVFREMAWKALRTRQTIVRLAYRTCPCDLALSVSLLLSSRRTFRDDKASPSLGWDFRQFPRRSTFLLFTNLAYWSQSLLLVTSDKTVELTCHISSNLATTQKFDELHYAQKRLTAAWPTTVRTFLLLHPAICGNTITKVALALWTSLLLTSFARDLPCRALKKRF